MSWASRVAEPAKTSPDDVKLEEINAFAVEKCAADHPTDIAALIVDSNAIIRGFNRHSLKAHHVYTVSEVLAEVKDKTARQALSTLDFEMKLEEPSEESIKAVMAFASATGDLHSLSSTDVKLIALTHTIHARLHGTDRLRSKPLPPKIQPKHYQGKGRDPPGWGTTVNSEEWGDIDQVEDDGQIKGRKSGKGTKSRVLGVKPLLPLEEDGDESLVAREEERELDIDQVGALEVAAGKNDVVEGKDGLAAMDLKGKNVAVGVNASRGENEEEEENEGEWEKSRSRSTRRKHVRRAIRAANQKAAIEMESTNEGPAFPQAEEGGQETALSELQQRQNQEQDQGQGQDQDQDQEGQDQGQEQDQGQGQDQGQDQDRELEDGLEEDGIEETVGVWVGDDGVEESESGDAAMADSANWEPNVACLTMDFAMQNVLLQMGLRLVSLDGMRVRELHRWALRCIACRTVSMESGRLFCPKCGNGGTMAKVSITVGEQGLLQAALPKRYNLRGTKFSLPLPVGGRLGNQNKVILREDQLPKAPHKKKNHSSLNVLSPDFNSWFQGADNTKAHATNHGTNTALLFRGKRNPNETTGRRRK